MSRDQAVTLDPLAPIAWIGRAALGVVGYLGGLAMLIGSAARSVFVRDRQAPPLIQAIGRQADWMLGMGVPLVGLVHIGMGSFLSMQSYFGATFSDAIGAVVGVGLLRNLASLMTGLTLAGLFAARIVSDLHLGPRPGLDEPAGWVPDRDPTFGLRAEEPAMAGPGRLALARLLAAAVIGPVLAVWGAFVGIMVGWGVGWTLLGTTPAEYWGLFGEMLWPRDLTGLVLKGIVYAVLAAALSTHEGLRMPSSERLPGACLRAACLSAVAILTVNSGWFLLFYHAGSAFGPTILAPPTR